MENVKLNNVKISAVACSLPVQKTKAEDYIGHFSERTVKRFLRTAGVKERYIGNGKQTAADLCFSAAEYVFNETDINREQIDVLIFITQNPDYKTPSTAFVLQKRLGLSQNCICFDVNMGCTAFLHGVYIASSMIAAGQAKKAMLLIGDAHLVHAETEDSAETMMFGEAGSAVVLENGTDQDQIVMDLFSDGNGFDIIMNACGERFQTPDDKPDVNTYKYYMDGGEVFNFSVTKVPEAIHHFCKVNKRELGEFDKIILHQANVFILKHIANELEVSEDQVAISMDRYGNTNGASIPVTIVDMVEREEELPQTMELLVSGFGIGLSWGVMSMKLDKSAVLPFVYSDDYYKEGKNISYLEK